VISLTSLNYPSLSCRSSEDKLAFAVHAYVFAQGYKLVSTGAQAEDPATDFASSQDREEVDDSGWDSLPGVYAFRYQDATASGKRAPLFLKCIVVGPKLLVQWMAGSSAQTHVLELDIDKYTTEAAASPAAYKNVEDLVKILDTSIAGGAGSGSAKQQQQQQEQCTRREADQEGEEPGPSHRGEEGYCSTLQEGGPPCYPAGGSGKEVLPPGIMPSSVGYEDVVPPGVRPPGYGGGYGGFGGIPAGPPHTGGGMHVGPSHPVFGPGKLGGGVGMPPEFGSRGDHGVPFPPGARWDPIGPPGTRGFRPDDFQQRDPSHPHPDMAQPGPGKGTDWDQFFG